MPKSTSPAARKGFRHSLSNETPVATHTTDAFVDIRPILDPRSIAVVGASDQPGNLGGETVRRLRKFIPGVPVIALFWGLSDDNSRYLDSIEATECDIVTTGLKETLRHVLAFARRADSVARTSQSAAQ